MNKQWGGWNFVFCSPVSREARYRVQISAPRWREGADNKSLYISGTDDRLLGVSVIVAAAVLSMMSIENAGLEGREEWMETLGHNHICLGEEQGAIQSQRADRLGEVPVGFTLSHKHQWGARTQDLPHWCRRFTIFGHRQCFLGHKIGVKLPCLLHWIMWRTKQNHESEKASYTQGELKIWPLNAIA